MVVIYSLGMGCFQIAPVWPGGRNWRRDYIGIFILCHWKRGDMGWGGRICLHSHPRHCSIGNHSQPDNRPVCLYSTWSRLGKLCCPPRSRKTPPAPLKMAITGNLSHTNLLMFMAVTEATRRTRGRPSEDLIATASKYLWEGISNQTKMIFGAVALIRSVWTLPNDAHSTISLYQKFWFIHLDYMRPVSNR